MSPDGLPTSIPTAIVLAAGLGTRLHPLTRQLAKPAIPFVDRPLIHYSLDLLKAGEVQEICVNLHHLPATVLQAVEGWASEGVRLQYSEEEAIQGTGGAFSRAAKWLGAADCFVAINGKIYFEQALGPVLQAHRESGAWVTMVVIPHSGAEPFNPVLLDEEGRIERFALGRDVQDYSRAYIYTGLQIISRQVLDLIPKGFSDTVKDLYPGLISHGRKLHAFVSDAFWCESSTPRRYLENAFQVAHRRAVPLASHLGREVLAGRDLQLAAGTDLSRVIAWDDVSVGAGSRLRNAILCSGCRVPAGLELANVVLTQCDDPEPVAGEVHEKLGSCLAWPLE